MGFLTTKTVALRLGVTTECIRYHERAGHLLAIKIERSPGVSQRLFIEEDVQRFQQQRETRALARGPHLESQLAASKTDESHGRDES